MLAWPRYTKMEFRTWGEYLQWLQDIQLPLFTNALGLSREVDAEEEKEKQQEKTDAVHPHEVLEGLDDSMARSELQLSQVEAEYSELLQMSAEFDQLTVQSRDRTALLLSHPVYSEHHEALTYAKTLTFQSKAVDSHLGAVSKLTKAAIIRRDQLQNALMIHQSMFEQEDAAHQARLAAARQQLSHVESCNRAYAQELASAHSRLAALSADDDQTAVEEALMAQAEMRMREEVAGKETEITAVQTDISTKEGKVTESERKASNSARLNLQLTLKTTEVVEAAGQIKDELQKQLAALAIQETSVEEGPFRIYKLKKAFWKRLEDQAKRLYAKKVVQVWRVNTVDVREVRQYREARTAEEEQWLQQKLDLEVQEPPKKPKAKKSKSRKKEGHKPPPKKLFEAVTNDDLLNSFHKMG